MVQTANTNYNNALLVSNADATNATNTDAVADASEAAAPTAAAAFANATR